MSTTIAATATASLYGPLTTAFVPPKSCMQNYYGGDSRGILGGHLGYDINWGILHDECFPPNYNPNRVALPVGWYSPGVCPSGYSVARVSTRPDDGLQAEYSLFSVSASLVTDETTVWCCPTGLYMSPHVELACEAWTSNIPVTTCVSRFLTTYINPSLGVISFQTCPSTGVATVSNTIQVAADPIFLKYRPSDLPVLQKISPSWGAWPGTIFPSSTGTSTASTHSTSGSANDNSDSEHGLSRDAKVAIGVTMPVFFVALLFGVFVGIRRRKRRPQNTGSPEAQTENPKAGHQPVQGGISDVVELDGTQDKRVVEIGTEKPQVVDRIFSAAEMDTQKVLAEMNTETVAELEGMKG